MDNSTVHFTDLKICGEHRVQDPENFKMNFNHHHSKGRISMNSWLSLTLLWVFIEIVCVMPTTFNELLSVYSLSPCH